MSNSLCLDIEVLIKGSKHLWNCSLMGTDIWGTENAAANRPATHTCTKGRKTESNGEGHQSKALWVYELAYRRLRGKQNGK
jgi:hypothetical protein